LNKKLVKKIIALTVLFLLVGVMASGCANNPSSNTSPTNQSSNPLVSKASPNDEYIFVLCLSNIEYFNAHKYEWTQLGKMFGVKTTIMGVTGMDMSQTSTLIDQAAAKKPKGICLFGIDPSLNPSINKAVEAGIPVVSIIGDQTGSKETSYIGSLGQDLGYLGGKKLAEAIGGKGKVAILTIPGNEQWDIREQGYRKAFAEYPGIQVAAVGDTKADPQIAAQVAKDIMVRYPDLAGFAGCDSTAAMGAATAVQEANLVGKVKIIGVDRNADELTKIQQGIITGSVAQNDAAMMYWALMVLMSHNYYTPPLTSDNEKSGVNVEPNVIYLPPNYVDQSNVQYFLNEDKVYAANNS
jgi:ABC-type sugar transport system substrate-binding protein